MDTEALNMIITLLVNLASDRMKLAQIEFENMLNDDKKIDRKETGTLLAGYKRAVEDMNNIFRRIGEI